MNPSPTANTKAPNGPRQRLATLAALLALQGCVPMPLTADRNPSLPQVRLNGHVLHAQAFGSPQAPVVVVVHGGPGADHRYLLGLQALADQYRVVFYDQLGSGLSERVPEGQISISSFLADLHAVVGHFSPGRPVALVGHSWGAMLATAYAGQHPQQVSHMVLAEPGFLDADSLAGLQAGGWPGWQVVAGVARAWLGQWRISVQDDPTARADWFLQQVMPLFSRPDSLCQGQLPPLQAWRFGSPAFAATLGRMRDDPAWAQSLNFAQGLADYRRPVLFLRGACNQAQPEAHQRLMMRRFHPEAQVRLQTVQDAGHYMFNDQPGASLAMVRQFLQEAPPAPGH